MACGTSRKGLGGLQQGVHPKRSVTKKQRVGSGAVHIHGTVAQPAPPLHSRHVQSRLPPSFACPHRNAPYPPPPPSALLPDFHTFFSPPISLPAPQPYPPDGTAHVFLRGSLHTAHAVLSFPGVLRSCQQCGSKMCHLVWCHDHHYVVRGCGSTDGRSYDATTPSPSVCEDVSPCENHSRARGPISRANPPRHCRYVSWILSQRWTCSDHCNYHPLSAWQPPTPRHPVKGT